MATQERELHEQFLKGITLKMVIIVIAGVISIVSSFWVGYNGIDKRITLGFVATNKHTDSLHNITQGDIKDLWNEIKLMKADKPDQTIIYRNIPNKTGYYTAKRDRYGNLTYSPVN